MAENAEWPTVEDSAASSERRWYEWPEWAQDALIADTDVHLSWRDAVRVLWKRRLTVSTKTFTASVIGRCDTMSRVYIEPWRLRPVGVVTSGETPKPAKDV